MKRSEINRNIEEAKAFFKTMNFNLPSWAFWKPEDWKGRRQELKEILECGLGWDITDFGSDNFEKMGLINFNLRNGLVNKSIKTYCEKIIIVKENQIPPLHTHRDKIEDIINRGGGDLAIELYNSDNDFQLTDHSVTVNVDAIPHTLPAGGKVVLTPGQSVFLVPGVFHFFYGEEGKGIVLVGEVSSVNDDNVDNIFVDGNPRFPEIEEDEQPLHLLINDYPRYV